MKLQLNRESLWHAWQSVASVAQQKSPKEILRYVKLIGGDRTVTLQAMDMEHGIAVTVPVNQDASGQQMLLPVDRVSGILRESSDETLTLEVADGKLLLSGRSSNFTLQTAAPDEYPELPAVSGTALRIESGELRRQLHRTTWCVDASSARYALGGVRLESDGEGQLAAVATDGRRLSLQMARMEQVEGRIEAIVPQRSALLLDRAIADLPDAVVEVSVSVNEISFSTAGRRIWTRQVEGRWPAWRQVIPKRENYTRMTVSVGLLHAALRQAAIVCSDETRAVGMRFADNSCTLAARTADIGQSQVQIPVPYTDAAQTIQIDWRYMADMLKVLRPESSIELLLEGPTSPMVIETPDGGTYVIMPLAKD